MIVDEKLFKYFEQVGTKIYYKAGDIVYMEEDDTQSLYLIVSGKVRVFKMTASGKEVTLEVLEKGAVFGESSLFEGAVRPTTVAAVSDAVLISCSISNMMPQIEKSPEFAIALIKILIERGDRQSEMLKKAYTYDRYQKVAAFLTEAADDVIHYTHEELSTCVGLSRVIVTKVLDTFAKEGFIENKYKTIEIKDREGLAAKYLTK